MLNQDTKYWGGKGLLYSVCYLLKMTSTSRRYSKFMIKTGSQARDTNGGHRPNLPMTKVPRFMYENVISQLYNHIFSWYRYPEFQPKYLNSSRGTRYPEITRCNTLILNLLPMVIPKYFFTKCIYLLTSGDTRVLYYVCMLVVPSTENTDTE